MKTLTGNDLALASNGIALALAWWKGQSGRSGFKRKEVTKLKALLTKFDAIQDHAYPSVHDATGEIILDYGDEPIMRTDEGVIRKAQRNLIKQGAVR